MRNVVEHIIEYFNIMPAASNAFSVPKEKTTNFKYSHCLMLKIATDKITLVHLLRFI